MFKAIFIAATVTLTTFTLSALSSQAATSPDLLIEPAAAAALAPATGTIETAYYCEWATVYDYWGNWVTVWQCY